MLLDRLLWTLLADSPPMRRVYLLLRLDVHSPTHSLSLSLSHTLSFPTALARLSALARSLARLRDNSKHIQFGVLSQQEIVNISELEVTHRDLYNIQDRTPVVNGVLDRKMVRSSSFCQCGRVRNWIHE